MYLTELGQEDLLGLLKKLYDLDDTGVANILDCGGKVTRRYIMGTEEMPERIYKRCIARIRKHPDKLLINNFLNDYNNKTSMSKRNVQFGRMEECLADKVDLLKVTLSVSLGRIIKNEELLAYMVDASNEKLNANS